MCLWQHRSNREIKAQYFKARHLGAALRRLAMVQHSGVPSQARTAERTTEQSHDCEKQH